MKTYNNIFNEIISSENLFLAWDAFKKDKRNKSDVMAFEWNLEKNIFQLHRELQNKTYKHGPYAGFYINDPKRRHIHKALVRDRILHHAIFSVINPIFEPTFINSSFSCRIGFGTHKGVDFLQKIIRKVSRNGKNPCFMLKCDIKKFFDSVDHAILLSIMEKRIKDNGAMWLLRSVIESYETNYAKGIPIGNLTSQFFANIYMNEFDYFIKHRLKIKNYARYTDDFVIVGENRKCLKDLLPTVNGFLKNNLLLNLHPNKIIIRKFCQGIDFLGYVIFPKYRLMRSKTKRRIFKKLKKRVKDYKEGLITGNTLEQSLQSYLGVLSHANTHGIKEELLNRIWHI